MIRIEHGISYGEGARQVFDLYHATGKARPILVYLYGGSWQSGRRAIYRFLGRSFARRGFLTAIPDYRLHPEVRFPAFPEDAARVLAFVRTHAFSWGGDPDNLFLMGHSAGAHSAALLAFEGARYGAPPLKGVIALAGPMSFNPLEHESVKAVFEGHAPIDEARPIKRAHGRAPPLLLLHGANDKTVGAHNSQHLAEAVRAAGGAAELKLYPGLGHTGIVSSIAWPLRWRASVLADILGFLSRHTGAPARTPNSA
jgi:acetyl esterase/lipase